jgi:hypothetical protein
MAKPSDPNHCRREKMPMDNPKQARARAEASFKKEERAREFEKARSEYNAEERARREKTARLKALRLAKEATEKGSEELKAARKTPR